MRHASHENHLDHHQEWINILKGKGAISKWKPSEDFFPAKEFSDQLLNDGNWNRFYRDNQNLSVEDKISNYEEMAKKVAERNGYSKNSKVSEKNNRTIFAAGKNRNRIYLALDTMHGTFEVCNDKGEHLGEYTFGGARLGEATFSHGIII